MSFKLISKEGSFCSIMQRIQEEAPTRTFIADHDCDRIGDAIVPKVKTPIELEIELNDIVFFDASGAGEEAEVLKSKGHSVIGAGRLNDLLELDRPFGLDFMRRHSIPLPESYTFQDIDETIEFVKKHPDRYVFKPSGNPSLSLTYVSTSPENMIGMLPYLKRESEKKSGGKCEFVLQQVVEGIEMSTEAWFNGKNFLLPLNSTFEEKKFMDGGRGTQTGCMGSVMWNWSHEISKRLYELLFRDMEEELADARYFGPLDVNAIWTPRGPFGLEFTPRFGFDAIQGFLRTLDISPANFFQNLGGMVRLPTKDDQMSMAVAVSTPPYPTETEEVPKVPILGISSEDLRDTVYFYDMMFDAEINMFTTSGAYNWVCSVTDNDVSFERLRRRIYQKVDTIEVADKQFRLDIGDRFVSDLRKVTKWIGSY